VKNSRIGRFGVDWKVGAVLAFESPSVSFLPGSFGISSEAHWLSPPPGLFYE
jgi:hypothetical protein